VDPTPSDAVVVGSSECRFDRGRDQDCDEESARAAEPHHTEGAIAADERSDDEAATQSAVSPSAPLTGMAAIRLHEEDRREAETDGAAEHERRKQPGHGIAARIDVDQCPGGEHNTENGRGRGDLHQALIGDRNAWRRIAIRSLECPLGRRGGSRSAQEESTTPRTAAAAETFTRR